MILSTSENHEHSAEARQRSAARYRRIVMGGGMAVVSKGISVLTTLISIPLTLHYLGTERFGLWMTVSSLVTIMAFADLGIGNGLVSAISFRHGANDHQGIAQYVSTATYALLGVSAVILGLFTIIYHWVPWPTVYSIKSAEAARETGPVTLVFVACLCANIPLAISQRVQMAFQESWLSNLWLSIGNVIGLLGVLVAVFLHLGLPFLALGLCGGPLVAGVMSALTEFGIRRPALRPKLSNWSPQILLPLLSTGSTFFLLQILTVAALGGIDNFLISAIGGVTAVPPYAVMLRYAQTVLVATVFLQPLWPALGESLGRGDFHWAQRALTTATRWTIFFGCVVACITALFGNKIISLWVGPALAPSLGMRLGFAAYIIVIGVAGVVATFMNNELFLRKQVTLYIVTTISTVSLKILFMRLWGVSGIAWAVALSFGIFYCPFGLLIAHRTLLNLARDPARPYRIQPQEPPIGNE